MMGKRMWAKQKGFTIVELLIVIVAFSGVHNRAHDAAVKNDLTAMAKQIMQYQILNDAYPRTTAHMAVI